MEVVQSRTVLYARCWAGAHVLALASMILVNVADDRCFIDMGSNGVVMRGFSGVMLICFLEICYLFYRSVKKVIGARRQTVEQANRTALALSAKGMCKAQKNRISDINATVDIFAAVILVVTVVSAQTAINGTNCVESFNKDIVDWVPALGAYSAVAWAMVLKVVVFSSQHDYTAQSLLLERSLPGRRNPFGLWALSSERRSICAMAVLIVGTVISGVSAAAFLKKPTVYAGYGTAALTLIVDGGLVFNAPRFLADAFVRILTCRSAPAADTHESNPCLRVARRPFYLNARPRRSAVLILMWATIGACLGGYMASNLRLLPLAGFLLFLAACSLGGMFLVADKPVDVDGLIKLGTEENFGFVASRVHLVLEISRALEAHSRNPHVGRKDATTTVPVHVPTYVASQDRVEAAAVISYRWTRPGGREFRENDPGFIEIRNKYNGMDWSGWLDVNQAEGMARALSRLKHDYVWWDQLCNLQACDQGSTPREAAKADIRVKLIPRMTGLYATAGICLALNSSGDARQDPRNWYSARVWTFQEYCVPKGLEIADITPGAIDDDIRGQRGEVARRFFHAGPRGGGQGARTRVYDEGAGGTGDEFIVDWVAGGDFAQLAAARVQALGSHDYLGLAASKGVACSHDILFTLGQSWFGVIMGEEGSERAVMLAIVLAEARAGGKELVVVDNTPDKPLAGSMSTGRFLSGPPQFWDNTDPRATPTSVQLMVRGDGRGEGSPVAESYPPSAERFPPPAPSAAAPSAAAYAPAGYQPAPVPAGPARARGGEEVDVFVEDLDSEGEGGGGEGAAGLRRLSGGSAPGGGGGGGGKRVLPAFAAPAAAGAGAGAAISPLEGGEEAEAGGKSRRKERRRKKEKREKKDRDQGGYAAPGAVMESRAPGGPLHSAPGAAMESRAASGADMESRAAPGADMVPGAAGGHGAGGGWLAPGRSRGPPPLEMSRASLEFSRAVAEGRVSVGVSQGGLGPTTEFTGRLVTPPGFEEFETSMLVRGEPDGRYHLIRMAVRPPRAGHGEGPESAVLLTFR